MTKPNSNIALAESFLAMAMKDEDKLEAEKAFSEFYDYYKGYVYTVVKKVCMSWKMYGDELVEAVFENTFIAIYDNAESFIMIEDIPFDRQEKRMKAWLGGIAKNEMFQLLRVYKVDKDRIEYTDDLSFYTNIDEDSNSQPSEDYLLAEKALKALSERDRDILVTYLMFQEGNKKLPSTEIKRLSEMWKVLPDNMRQIKKRSLRKLEIYIITNRSK